MSTPASIKGQPIHAMMIGLPAGLFVFSFVSDVVWMFTGSADRATVASCTLAGAVMTAVSSADQGFIDDGGIESLLPAARWTAGGAAGRHDDVGRGTREARRPANNVTARPGRAPLDSPP